MCVIAANDGTEPGAADPTGLVGTTFMRNNLTYEITGVKIETYYDEEG